MQTLRKVHGYPAVRRALRFLAIRLKSRPTTATLAEEVTAARNGVEGAREAWEQASEERIAQTAEIAYLDGVVDGCVMAVAREFNVLAGGKLDDERRPLLFRKAPSEVMKDVGSDNQTQFVNSVVYALRNESSLQALKHLAHPLDEAQGRLTAAIARRADLATPEARAAAHLTTALERGRRTYNRMHAQLTLLLGDEALVESFFTAHSKTTESKEHEEMVDEDVPA